MSRSCELTPSAFDQGLKKEKNYQVPLMKTAYTNANIVRVWLGEGTKGSEEAMRVLNELGHGNPPRMANVRIDGTALDIGYLVNLRDLLKRSWWRRIWVQQELVLATKLIMQCGSRCLDNDMLSKFVIDIYEILSRWDYSSYDYTVFAEMWEGFADLQYFLLKRQDYRYNMHMETSFANVQMGMKYFLEWLCLARGSCCANQRDSVYGLLGLAPNDFASILDPDFGLSIVEVYQHMAVLFFLYTNSLALFSATQFQRKDQRLTPTWVPDWRGSAAAMRVSAGGVYQQVLWNLGGHFNACGQRKLHFELGSDFVVTLSGIILNHVGAMMAMAPVGNGVSKRNIESDWRKFFDYHNQGSLKSVDPGSESPESPYWRLLTKDLCRATGDRRRCKVEDRESYITWVSVESVAANDITRFFNNDLKVHDVRLFFTANGFVGVGPAAMETDDSISILAGGSLPCVLRPVPDAARLNTFELVGSCYVHGIMDGQAIHGFKEDEPHLPGLDILATEWYDIYLV